MFSTLCSTYPENLVRKYKSQPELLTFEVMKCKTIGNLVRLFESDMFSRTPCIIKRLLSGSTTICAKGSLSWSNSALCICCQTHVLKCL